MRPPSHPVINKSDPKKYFIDFNHDVPPALWHKYPRKRVRLKMYDVDNRLKGDERERQAEERRKVWEYLLFELNYNPFTDELDELYNLQVETELVHEAEVKQEQAEVAAAEAAAALTPDQIRKATTIGECLDQYWINRQEHLNNPNTLSTYKGNIGILRAGFEELELINKPASEITRHQVATILKATGKERKWENSTYNNELNKTITFFNWLELEEYIVSDPISGKVPRKREKKHKHKWYDRESFKTIIEAVRASGRKDVLRAMQFTYYIQIRSQQELMKLKFGDIDRVLKRVRFSADLSKDDQEHYRDYDPEFDLVLDEMFFDKHPKDWYVIGRLGEPGPFKCSKNHLANHFRPIRDDAGLSDDYTIYGCKHTWIIHQMMKGKDGYWISYQCRHDQVRTTEDYKRDYDFTLANVYGPEDLTFYRPG